MGKRWDQRRLYGLWLLVLLVAGGCDGCSCFDFGGGDGCAPLPCSSIIGCGDDTLCQCADGTPCFTNGQCEGDVVVPPINPCADSEDPCGNGCCDGGEVCWFEQCVTPGSSCSSPTDCAPTETCSYGQAAATIDIDVCVEPLDGACMPSLSECYDSPMPGCRPRCELADLDVGSAGTIPSAHWGDPAAVDAADSIISPPVVAQLDDDDCNDVVDWRDAPDLVFMTATIGATAGHGRLVAATLGANELVEKWSDVPVTSPNDPATQIASARHDGEAYVVVCTDDERVRAYDHLGGERWLSEPLLACDAPAVGILDGAPAVVTEGGILSLTTGVIEVAFTSALSGPPIIADVHAATAGNEIVTPNEVRAADGTPIADTARPGSFVAVADLDGDTSPEMITVESQSGQHHLVVWQLDPAGSPVFVRTDIDLHGSLSDPCLVAEPGADRSGGPPTIADLTGDGSPDVAVAGARGLVVFDGAALMNALVNPEDTLVAEVSLSDCSDGRRGVSAFDFDDDGALELVARDAQELRIVSAIDGSILWSTCAPSEPGFGLTPIVDADRDGSADLIGFASARDAAECGATTHAGVSVYGHPGGGWAGAPRVWSQHAELTLGGTSDGTLVDWVSPWTEVGVQGVHAPPATRQAPNLRVSIRPQCSLVMEIEVENLGLTPVPARTARVRLYGSSGGSSTEITLLPVPVSLEAGAAVILEHQLDGMPWEGFTASLEIEDGYEVFDCEPDDDTMSFTCFQ